MVGTRQVVMMGQREGTSPRPQVGTWQWSGSGDDVRHQPCSQPQRFRLGCVGGPMITFPGMVRDACVAPSDWLWALVCGS